MKKKPRLRLVATKSPQFDQKMALARLGQHYMEAERTLTPLIRTQRMSPAEAVVLLATAVHARMTGTQEMTEQELVAACQFFVRLWKERLFVPGPDFPYSLQKILEVMEGNEE